MSPSPDIAAGNGSGDRPAFRLAVLISGNGSNLQAVIDACADGRLAAEVAVVVSNNPDAYGLERAERAGVPTLIARRDEQSRRDYDQELALTLATVGVDLVVLAGWDHLLSEIFVAHHAVINLHPAKPGMFPGLGAIERSFEAWRSGRIDAGGVMVHFVPDEGIDNGPVIATEEVPIKADDTLAQYAERVHMVEHRLLVEAIGQVLAMAANQALR